MINAVTRLKHRVRLLQLLRASDHAALAPIDMGKLHAFAYLADILSPVWQLRPFEDTIGRTNRPPYYPDFQRELDLMVAMGLVEPSQLEYTPSDDGKPARFAACYALRTDSAHLPALMEALRDDDDLVREQDYLNSLAGALASIPDDDIAQAARRDLAYEGGAMDTEEFFELDPASASSLTSRAVASFDQLFPEAHLTPARRLYMYAAYLGKRVHA